MLFSFQHREHVLPLSVSQTTLSSESEYAVCHWPIYLCHVLYNTYALNYTCLNMQMLEQPSWTPHVGSSFGSICSWLWSLSVRILGCSVSVTPWLCSVCSSSVCRSPAAEGRDTSRRTFIQTRQSETIWAVKLHLSWDANSITCFTWYLEELWWKILFL